MPIEMLVDCGSNATIITIEAFNKIKFEGHKLASSAEKLMDCQSNEIPVLEIIPLKLKLERIHFVNRFLVTKLDKCLLRNSFITEMKFFDWNNFLINSYSAIKLLLTLKQSLRNSKNNMKKFPKKILKVK